MWKEKLLKHEDKNYIVESVAHCLAKGYILNRLEK